MPRFERMQRMVDSVGERMVQIIDRRIDRHLDKGLGLEDLSPQQPDIDTDETSSIPETSVIPGSIEDGLSQTFGPVPARLKEKANYAEERVTEVRIEHFQSEAFQQLGYSTMPERFGTSDGSFSTVSLDNGQSLFVVSSKESDSPYSAGHAGGQFLDFRPTESWIYAYDGQETITAYSPDGSIDTYTGEWGLPSALIPAMAERLGKLVDTQIFADQ